MIRTKYQPGAVAQWSEQGTHNPSVAGSIPAGPTRMRPESPTPRVGSCISRSLYVRGAALGTPLASVGRREGRGEGHVRHGCATRIPGVSRSVKMPRALWCWIVVTPAKGDRPVHVSRRSKGGLAFGRSGASRLVDPPPVPPPPWPPDPVPPIPRPPQPPGPPQPPPWPPQPPPLPEPPDLTATRDDEPGAVGF